MQVNKLHTISPTRDTQHTCLSMHAMIACMRYLTRTLKFQTTSKSIQKVVSSNLKVQRKQLNTLQRWLLKSILLKGCLEFSMKKIFIASQFLLTQPLNNCINKSLLTLITT